MNAQDAHSTAPGGTPAPAGAALPGAPADAGPLPTRWSIEQVLLYSLDGRRRTLDLVPNTVNIITGKSGTGKSALAEIIDYTMGASEGRLPRRVREASSWVGLVWVNGGTRCVICRRVYEPPLRATDDFFYHVGADVDVPETTAGLKRTLGRDAMLSRFEALLGIGNLTTEVFSSETRQPVRVSLRNAMPYLLQDAAHIINNAALLRGSDDQRRQHLIDTMPYYLGVVDEATVAREAALKRLRVRIVAEEQRLASRRAAAGDGAAAARRLLREGAQLGLAADLPDDADAETVYEALRAMVSRPATSPTEAFESNAELDRLYDRERELLAEGARTRAQAEAARRALSAATDFAGIGDAQRQRLDVIDLLPDTGDRTCPLCVQPLGEHAEAARSVRRAVERVRRELGEVARERPKLDGVLIELDARREQTAARLAAVRTDIIALVGAMEDRERGMELKDRRLLLLGRAAEHLGTAAPRLAVDADTSALDALRADETALAAGLDVEAKMEAMDLARARITGAATDIASRLPMEEDYRGHPVDFNPRTLAVSILTALRREDMREIGSDENILTLHVAVLLALHRLFAERQRPVPGVLLFDQLSRPYYPPDPLGAPTEESVIEGENEGQPEVTSLKRYFAALFEEAERKPGLQIIILEHAYFSDDPRFTAATRERWIAGKALVPADWPNRVPTPAGGGTPPTGASPEEGSAVT